MRSFLLLLLTILCSSFIHAQVINIPNNTQQWIYQSNQTLNRPTFSAYINICNATSNQSIVQLDVKSELTKVNYSNNRLTFTLPTSRIGDEFYVTFDAGVLYSNDSVNSSAQTGRNFLYFKVVDLQTSTVSDYTSMVTSQFANTATLTSYNNTSVYTATTGGTTQMTDNPTTINSTTSAIVMNTGEPPPTRSAQLGMGLGITFITVLILIEIMYFKFCYTGNGRSQSYYT